jgi:hypothetical protein
VLRECLKSLVHHIIYVHFTLIEKKTKNKRGESSISSGTQVLNSTSSDSTKQDQKQQITLKKHKTRLIGPHVPEHTYIYIALHARINAALQSFKTSGK